jgi:ABC-type nitrate/sulfonate/bicarbonate transport system permease component
VSNTVSGDVEQLAAPERGPTAPLYRLVREPGNAERRPRVYQRRRRTIEVTLAIAVPLLLLGLWEIASTRGWIDRRLYPAPSDIVSETRRQFAEQHRWHDVWVSTRRILWGYALGGVAGLLFGYLLGISRLLRASLEPTLNALYTVPKLAVLPLFLLILGFGEEPVIAVIAVTVFFFVWIQTMASVVAVPAGYRETAASFGANRWEMFRHVLLPASLPQVFVGLRVAAGVAVLTLIGVEFVFAPGEAGIGFVINQGRQVLLPKQTYMGIIIAALMGALFITIVKLVGRLVAPWAQDESPHVNQ